MSKNCGKFLLGIGVGVGLGFLFAPKKGSETREELRAKLEEMLAKVKEIDIVEVKESIRVKIEELKEELSELDKEKVLKIAKEKSKALLDKANELVKYAVEKGTPVLQKSANAIREKAIDVTKEVLVKLENKEK